MKMVRLLKFTVSLAIYVTAIECKTLPKYIRKCSIKNPDEFTKCAVEVGNAALKEFIHGDKEYKISNMMPLELPLVELSTAGLNLTLSKALVTGVENSKLKSIKYDKMSKKFYVDAFMNKLEIDGHYKVEGKVMVLPISGEGHATLDFLDGDYSFIFDLKPVVKNGKDVIKVQPPEVKTKFGGAHFQLDNLFNGNDNLGKEMNKFLNDNWNDVVQEFNSLIVAPVSEIVHSVYSAFLDDLAYDEVFSDL